MHEQCEKWKGNILKGNNVLKFMMDHMNKLGSPMDNNHFICRPCDQPAGGHFVSGEGIVLCENHLRTQQQTADTMIHETIHAYDESRVDIDWSDCRHHACSEIRAANLSGDCSFFNELQRGNLWNFTLAKKHQECVRRRAILSLQMTESCQGKAEEVVDSVFEACFNDLHPFDEIY